MFAVATADIAFCRFADLSQRPVFVHEVRQVLAGRFDDAAIAHRQRFQQCVDEVAGRHDSYEHVLVVNDRQYEVYTHFCLEPQLCDENVRHITVEVRLDGSLPEGARPDMAVDGAIQIQLLTDVLFIGRPVQSQENATMGRWSGERRGPLRISSPRNACSSASARKHPMDR